MFYRLLMLSVKRVPNPFIMPSSLCMSLIPFQDVRSALVDQCLSNPDRFYLVSPPMYRKFPLWYRENLPEILTLFSQVLSPERPDNLLLLPSYPTPEYENNGIHLTAYSGLEFISYLFDSSQDAISSLSLPQPEVALRSCEATRVLEDRVTCLEQDHRRLSSVLETKIAADSEINDARTNEGFENYFIIAGLERIPFGAGRKALAGSSCRRCAGGTQAAHGSRVPDHRRAQLYPSSSWC